MSQGVSDCTELAWNLRRDVEVADGEIDHVGKGLQMSKPAGPVLDDLDNSVDTFCDGVGHSGFNEGEDTCLVAA